MIPNHTSKLLWQDVRHNNTLLDAGGESEVLRLPKDSEFEERSSPPFSMVVYKISFIKLKTRSINSSQCNNV